MLHLLVVGSLLATAALCRSPLETPYSLSDAFLQNVLSRYEPRDYPDPEYVDFMDRVLRQPVLQYDGTAGDEAGKLFHPRDSDGYGLMDYDYKQAAPSLRDREFLQHSSLWGNQYVAGGAGEGRQRLRPEGSIKNTQVTKTDAVLPAYCEPPNPCPVGYTGSDGCLETFENSAAFSREYQARQQCMCDTEHMFNCPDSTRDSEMSALARSISNKGLDNIMDPAKSKVVAKKYHLGKSYMHANSEASSPGGQQEKHLKTWDENPYLRGDKLPVAAKKGHMKRG